MIDIGRFKNCVSFFKIIMDLKEKFISIVCFYFLMVNLKFIINDLVELDLEFFRSVNS